VYFGIELDNATGKHDGSYQGKRKFGPTRENCGVFVPPTKIVDFETPTSYAEDEAYRTSYQDAFAHPTRSNRRIGKSKNASLRRDIIPDRDLTSSRSRKTTSAYDMGSGEYSRDRRRKDDYIDTSRRRTDTADLSYDATGVTGIFGTLYRMGVPGSDQMDKLVKSLGITTPPSSPPGHHSSRSKEQNRKKLPRGARGLANLGNTCFFNSVVQCLNSNEQLVKLMVGANHDKASKLGEVPEFSATKTLASQLQKLFQSLHSGVQESFRPKAMLAAISGTPGGDMYGTGRQQDAHELLIFLLDKLDEEYKEGFPSLLLQGRLSSTVTCLACRNPSTKDEEFWSLELDLKSHKSATPRISHSSHSTHDHTDSSSHETVDPDRKFDLTDLLGSQGFTRKEHLQGDNRYYCEKCKEKQKATKQFTIGSPPGTLILHLKRFSYDKYGNEGKKLQNDVAFPKELDLKDLDLMTPESRALQTGYYLRAVVVHKGLSLGRGHYIAYARYKDTGKWFCYNDSDVTQVKYDKVKEEQAYLLFYDNMSGQDL